MRNDGGRAPDRQAYQGLLKFWGCSFPQDGGNEKERTMIVEEQGIGSWTRVRLPSGPLTMNPCKYGIFPLFTRVFLCFGRNAIALKRGSFFMLYATRMQHENHTFFIFSKCRLILFVCRTVSRSMVFRYTDFMILSEAHPPRCRIYWSGTPIACITLAA